MKHRIELLSRLDSGAADALHQALSLGEGQDIELDASNVTMLGGLCLELLLCARQVWKASGKTITVEEYSDAFSEHLARFGITPRDLSAGVAS